jgi:hypothetical protein
MLAKKLSGTRRKRSQGHMVQNRKEVFLCIYCSFSNTQWIGLLISFDARCTCCFATFHNLKVSFIKIIVKKEKTLQDLCTNTNKMSTMMRRQPTLQELRKCKCRKKENCECKNPNRLTTNDTSKDAYNQSNCLQSKTTTIDWSVTFAIFHANLILKPQAKIRYKTNPS